MKWKSQEEEKGEYTQSTKNAYSNGCDVQLNVNMIPTMIVCGMKFSFALPFGMVQTTNWREIDKICWSKRFSFSIFKSVYCHIISCENQVRPEPVIVFFFILSPAWHWDNNNTIQRYAVAVWLRLCCIHL